MLQKVRKLEKAANLERRNLPPFWTCRLISLGQVTTNSTRSSRSFTIFTGNLNTVTLDTDSMYSYLGNLALVSKFFLGGNICSVLSAQRSVFNYGGNHYGGFPRSK
jgi:hypothetical protein